MENTVYDTADYLATEILEDEELFLYNRMKKDPIRKQTYRMINHRNDIRGKSVLMSNLDFETYCLDAVFRNRIEIR